MVCVSREAWVTGCGIVSALGAGYGAHWAALDAAGDCTRFLDSVGFAPFHVHPIVDLDLDRYIPRKGDQRAMGPLMHYGVCAAGMALESAGVAGDRALLERMALFAASGGGERDLALDEQILALLEASPDPDATLNEQLANGLRPTLFLAQLPNLFAGNISIVHGVTGSSRTFMGEEAAGFDAVRIAFERLRAGQADLFLVGAAFNASRWDMLIIYQPAGLLLSGPFRGLWRRPQGGLCLGSVGAFLVLESRASAEQRGAVPLARLAAVHAGRCRRGPGAAARNAGGLWDRIRPLVRSSALAVMCGACGVGNITAEEREFLTRISAAGPTLAVRGTAAAIGHSLEASFPANLALAVCCLRHRAVFPPLAPDEPLENQPVPATMDQVLVTGFGHQWGEALALVESVD